MPAEFALRNQQLVVAVNANTANPHYMPTKEKNSLIRRGDFVDDVSRGVITCAGFGEQFTHRTGHSIGEETHGNGVNIDDFETRDSRRITPGVCFSIEPGIYFEGKFGVRSEINVYVSDKDIEVTGQPIQMEIIPILKPESDSH